MEDDNGWPANPMKSPAWLAEDNRRDALLGIDLDHHWAGFRGRPDLSVGEWCGVWRTADRRPPLDGPIRLYRGGGSPYSMSWTDDLNRAGDFADLCGPSGNEYRDVLGDVRLPIWAMEFPPEAILGVLRDVVEFVVDIERFPPNEAVVFEPLLLRNRWWVG